MITIIYLILFFKVYMLQHFSPPENHYRIVKDGFLRPSIKTNNTALYGRPSKWIYTRLDTDINKQDHYYHFLLDEKLLLLLY
jgi:hypothetical protein